MGIAHHDNHLAFNHMPLTVVVVGSDLVYICDARSVCCSDMILPIKTLTFRRLFHCGNHIPN